LKIGVPGGCLGEILIFKIMIADVTLWSKLELQVSRFYQLYFIDR